MLARIIAIVQIRYNTLSDGSHLCWRLILDGVEYIVNDITIEAPCFTSKDRIEGQNVFKHHITAKNCSVMIDDDGKATILPLDKLDH